MSNLFVKDFEVLKDKKKQLDRLKKECDRYFEIDLPVEHPKKSTTYMGIAIFNLALMYKVSGEKKYYDEAIRWIDTVVSYPNWGNAHLVNLDLSAAWILFGLSIGYDWLKEELDSNKREAIKNKLIRHARFIYDYAVEHRTNSWPIEYWQNHNWIDHTGLAAAGYALKDEDEMSKIYTSFALDDFKQVFKLLSDDGSNYEGVVYWRYGGMWLFVYAYLIKEIEGIDFFSSSDYLKNTFYYKLYQSTGSLCYGIDYGDCHDHISSNPVCVYYLTARMYNNGYAQALGNKILDDFFETEAFESKVKPGLAPEAGFELVWYDPTVDEKDISELPLYRFFPDLGLLTVRESWKPNSKIFSFKCSAPGGKKQWEYGTKLYKEGIKSLSLSHHHPDNQAFFIVRGDDYLTLEDGYNRNIIPGSHNTILVDGHYTDAIDCNDVYMSSIKKRLEDNPSYDIANYYGEIDYFKADDNIIMLSSRNERIYPLGLAMNMVCRKILCYKMKYIILVDILNSDTEHEYTVINNSDVYPEKKDDFYFYNVHGAEYRVFSNRKISSYNKDIYIKAVMTTQEPDNYVERFIKSLQHSSATKVKDQIFIHIINYDDVKLSASFADNVLCVNVDDEKHEYKIMGEKIIATLNSINYEF